MAESSSGDASASGGDGPLWIPAYAIAALSVAGNAFLIGTFARLPSARQAFTTRLIVPLAVANLINCGTVLAFQPAGQHKPLEGWLCVVAGALNWGSIWAQWLWTMPYAAAVWQCFVAARRAGLNIDHFALGFRHELAYHLVCWGVPALLVVAGLCIPSAETETGHLFGALKPECASDADGVYSCLWLNDPAPGWRRGESDPCTTDGSSSPFFYVYQFLYVWGLLLGAIVFNVVAYSRVQLMLWELGRSLTASTSLGAGLAAEEKLAIRMETTRRLRLWPRFLAYMCTFILCTGPGCVFNLLVDLGVFSGFSERHPRTFEHLAMALTLDLTLLHGFLNAVVYGSTNPAILAAWRECCERRRGGLQEDDRPAARITNEHIWGRQEMNENL